MKGKRENYSSSAFKFERTLRQNVIALRVTCSRARKMTDVWRLDSLPSDVLLIIFEYCNEYDLLRLSQVCKRFYEIVRADTVWVKKSKEFLVTNQTSERFRERCHTILHPRATWHVSYNWRHGRYKNVMLFSRKARLMPWLKMTNDRLWWCGGNELLSFKRKQRREGNCLHYKEAFVGSDIRKFVLWKNFIICGYMDGTIKYFSIVGNKFRIAKILLNNRSCVNAIDATLENVIVGLECGEIKIYRHPDMDAPERNVSDEEICVHLMDKVKSLSIDPTGVKFAVGSSGINGIPPLHVIDIERYTMIDTMQHTWKHGAGILDMVWDDPNTLLTCGYDTYIRKWDMRTKKCVCSWPDPTDATLYCISSDHQYTVATGTQHSSLAVLWDQRKCDFVQLYYMSTLTSRYSPIYSIQFDNTHLYCATDQHVIELNFSPHPYYKELDYKSVYSYILGTYR